jgi:MFS family permease
MLNRRTTLLLNAGHAIDHWFLLILAAAVVPIARDFGFAGWESLLPYGAGAFLMFGLGSVPAGRLGDLWGRRPMLLVYFFGLGASALLAAATQSAWQLAAALSLLGAFASIYHPVGIPMLVQRAANPGTVIGVNGLAGNLGIALASLVTGALVSLAGWRAAFALPGLLCLLCGVLFAMVAPPERDPPARRAGGTQAARLSASARSRVFAVMTATAVTGSLLFNFTTNGNAQLIRERLAGVIEDPATLGALLAAVYALASLTQLVVGRCIDRFGLKRLYLAIVVAQVPLFAAAAYAQGWALLVLQTGFMAVIFGAIPFTDAMIVRYVDDRMRSRVSGVRLAVSFGVSSAAVWLMGPLVHATSFRALLLALSALACCTALTITRLPAEPRPAH